MKKWILIPLCLGLEGLAGCAMQRPLFKSPLVSVTESSVDTAKKPESLGPVNAKYCPGDDPLIPGNKNIGMLDEVIARAQHDKNARYIKDVQFYTEGRCVTLEGVAFR